MSDNQEQEEGVILLIIQTLNLAPEFWIIKEIRAGMLCKVLSYSKQATWYRRLCL